MTIKESFSKSDLENALAKSPTELVYYREYIRTGEFDLCYTEGNHTFVWDSYEGEWLQEG